MTWALVGQLMLLMFVAALCVSLTASSIISDLRRDRARR